MKSREFIKESGTGSLSPAVAHALPSTYELPGLKNQDPYMQYRLGVAMAGAKDPGKFETQSAFGENMSVVSYTPQDEEILKLALKLIGKEYSKGAHRISTEHSEEATDVNTQSPVSPKGPIKRNETIQDHQ